MSQVIFPFLLGFLSISFQILLLREFLVQFYGNEVIYGFVLGFWLLWGSLGSLLAKKIRLQPQQIRWLFQLNFILAVLVFSGLRLIRFFWDKSFGESLGIAASFFTALASCALLSFPFGLLFFLNVLFLKGDISKVYIFESLGAGLAGLAIDLFFIPHLACWPSLGILGIISCLIIAIISPSKKAILVSSLIILCLIFFIGLDIPLQKISARPFPLIKSHDSRFGRWQIIKIDDQITLYQDGLAVASIPDPAEAEEIIHFALLQRPKARKLLLIGGGLSGAIEEALKYPLVTIDYVEIDPDILEIIKPFLQPEKQYFFNSPRVRIHHLDGRVFLRQSKEIYDVIILAVPEPATAQLNRFYSQEFFALIKRHLSADGLISLRLSSAENYQNPKLMRFLNNLFKTLSSIFLNIEVIPGDTNIFLASDSWLKIDLDYLASTLERYQIKTQIIRPQVLLARLNSLRLENLRERIKLSADELNKDLHPRGYFYFMTFWASQFGLNEAGLLEFFLKIPPFILIILPLSLILLIFAPLFISRRREALPGLSLIVLGFTTMMAETLILLWFQLRFGYIYEKIALLIAAFMFGLFFGALFGRKLSIPISSSILADQISFIILLLLLKIALPLRVSSLILYLFLFLLGIIGGHLFIISNQPLIEKHKSYGLGYGLDLAGSFFGAILGPPLFFPLLGLPKTILSLLILNVFALLAFLPYGLKKITSSHLAR